MTRNPNDQYLEDAFRMFFPSAAEVLIGHELEVTYAHILWPADTDDADLTVVTWECTPGSDDDYFVFTRSLHSPDLMLFGRGDIITIPFMMEE